MKKQTLYYIETSFGCGLRAAYNLEEATQEARLQSGTDNFKRCTMATAEHIAWVKGMGGFGYQYA